MKEIKTRIRKVKNGFMGYAEVWSLTGYLYCQASKITRLNKVDALIDAKILISDLTCRYEGK